MIETLERPSEMVETTPARAAARLSVSRLTAGHGQRVPAIRDVSFDLPDGGLLAVVGPSGVGKSTLCAALLGEAQVRTGEARLADQPLLDGSVVDPSRVGFVPQDNAAIGELTVARTVRFAADIRLPEAGAADRDARVRSVLDRLQLTGTAGQRVRELSGGQRRRLAIAVELLTDPPLLMLDEPTSGLDDGLDRHLMRDLADLADDGRSVVVVTHSTAHLDYATAVLALSAGRPRRAPSASSNVGYFGPPEQLAAGFAGRSSADVMDALRNGETSALGSLPVPVAAEPADPEEVPTLAELLVPRGPAGLEPAPGWEAARVLAASGLGPGRPGATSPSTSGASCAGSPCARSGCASSPSSRRRSSPASPRASTRLGWPAAPAATRTSARRSRSSRSACRSCRWRCRSRR